MLTRNLLNQNLYPNNDYDWIKKLYQGKFKQFSDCILRVQRDGQVQPMMLSEKLEELGVDMQFLQNIELDGDQNHLSDQHQQVDKISSESDKEQLKHINEQYSDVARIRLKIEMY